MEKNFIDNYYHVFNKSIAGYQIFNNAVEFERMINVLKYYQSANVNISYSKFLELPIFDQHQILSRMENDEKLVEIVAYCLMPTHYHLILKQLRDKGISKYIANVCNSYTRYFNLKHERKGPLWQSNYKSVLIDNDQQLLHLTRYVHLNPVTAGIVKRPEDWPASSYNEYISGRSYFCNYQDVLDITPRRYENFVNSQISYQQKLYLIRKLILD